MRRKTGDIKGFALSHIAKLAGCVRRLGGKCDHGHGMSGAVLGVIAVILTGCATIVTGTSQSLFVDTMNVQGASCKGVDNKGREYYWPNTPSATSVQKGDAPLVITCEKPGFKKTTYTVEETFQGATLGNIILGGGIGIFVDIATGAAQKYPSVVRFPMEPDESAPPEAKAAYQKAKEQLAEEQKKAQESPEPGR